MLATRRLNDRPTALEHGADLTGLFRQTGPEKHPGDDLQGEARHVGEEVARFAFVVGIGEAFGRFDHDGPVSRQAFAVEQRLQEPALPQPGVAVAGEQAVAEQQAVHLEGVVLDPVAGVRHQDRFDQVGVVDEDDAAQAEAQSGHVAELAGAAGVERQRVAAQLGQVAAEERAFRPRREGGGHGRVSLHVPASSRREPAD